MTTPLIEVESLSVTAGLNVLVDDVAFTLESGSRTGIIGESGSGKTMTALAIMGLLPDGLTATGSVRLRGEELLGQDDKELVTQRGNSMSMILSSARPTRSEYAPSWFCAKSSSISR